MLVDAAPYKSAPPAHTGVIAPYFKSNMLLARPGVGGIRWFVYLAELCECQRRDIGRSLESGVIPIRYGEAI